MNVFVTAESHMSWLASRQAVAATNLANADTSGFKALSVTAFGKEMDAAAARLSVSHPSHLQPRGKVTGNVSTFQQNNREVTLSGNDVVIEKEMRVVGENAKLFNFDVGLLKSFHRMVLTSLKG
jgi:flagellar basal-body rod protein FlgB